MNKVNYQELRAIFHLAFPLILNLLAYIAMQLVDTAMLGRLGPLALAASALGAVVYFIILVGCLGVLTAVGTLCAESYGEKNLSKVAIIGQQGLWLVFLLAAPTLLYLWNAHHLLFLIKEPSAVILGAKEFLHGLFWGFLAQLWFISLREFLTSLSKPRIVMWISIGAVPLNAWLNYWFMYGGHGLPAMGIFGVGLASSLVEWLMLLVLVSYMRFNAHLRDYAIFNFNLPRWDYLKRICLLGLPVGITYIIEEFLFGFSTLLMGYLGVTALASHQIALQCLFLVSMIQLGITQATTIRVSQLLGAGQVSNAKRSAYLSIASGMTIAVFIACILWFVPQYIVGIFLDVHQMANQPEVGLAIKLIMIIAMFHIIDAGQLVTNGALRGYQDTLIPMFLGIFSFWVIGVGSGYLLGFMYGWGAQGLWWGLALGVSVSFLLVQLRLRAKSLA